MQAQSRETWANTLSMSFAFRFLSSDRPFHHCLFFPHAHVSDLVFPSGKITVKEGAFRIRTDKILRVCIRMENGFIGIRKLVKHSKSEHFIRTALKFQHRRNTANQQSRDEACLGLPHSLTASAIGRVGVHLSHKIKGSIKVTLSFFLNEK